MARFHKSEFRPSREWIDEMPGEARDRAEVEARRLIAATHLADLRRALTVTQSDLARSAGIKQSEVSRVENNLMTVQLRTVGRYIAGLGGTLSLVAEFPDGSRAEIPIQSGRPVKSKTTVQ